jgi:L-lactate dehydrogenase complex protein LldE
MVWPRGCFGSAAHAPVVRLSAHRRCTGERSPPAKPGSSGQGAGTTPARICYIQHVRIAIFITCLTDNFYPRVGIAMVKVLEHLGHEVVFPPEQTCCGQPMFNTGFHDDARALAERMVRLLEPYEVVVTPSGSCAAMLREHYIHLLQPDPTLHAAARALAARSYEFIEFLTRVLRVDLRAVGAGWRGNAAYHCSCHLRALGLAADAPSLMQQVTGLTVVPTERAEQCCGFGGTFAVDYPSISGTIVRDKVECIRRTGAEWVVCNDAGCALNIEGACRREGCNVRLISLAEIIAESLGLLESGAPA